jgi:hypothetical protein
MLPLAGTVKDFRPKSKRLVSCPGGTRARHQAGSVPKYIRNPNGVGDDANLGLLNPLPDYAELDQ